MSVSAQQQIQILHVDDDPAITDLTAQFLERESDRFTVETATSADDGLQILSDHTPDCIVSDYNMPGMNGLEFLRTVRNQSPDLPFILFTGKGSEEVASDAIAADVTHYLQKGNGTERYELLANRIENAVEQYRAQTELQARERRFKALLEHSPDRLFILDEDGHYQFISPSMERIMGFSPEEMEGKASRQFIHPEDRKKVADVYQQVLANPDEVYTLEYRVRHKDGSWRWVESRERNRLDDPVINGVVVNSRDITERKQREQQLAREHDIFETLIETLPEPAILVSGENEIDATISRVNPAFEETFGYEEPEIVDEHINDLIVPPDRQEEAEQIDQTNVAGDLLSTEVRRQTADGELRDFLLLTSEFATHSSNDPKKGFAIYADITEQKQAQRTTERERTRFKQLFETLPEPTAIVSGGEGLTIKQVNPAFEAVFGYDEAAIQGEDLNTLIVPPEYEDEATDLDDMAIEGEVLREEVERQTADGSRRDFLMFATGEFEISPEEDAEGFVIYADITERKQLEEELREKSSLLDSIFERLPIHLYVKDREGRKVWVSSNFVDDPESHIGKTDLELYPEEFARKSYADDMEVIETGDPIIDKEEHVEYIDEWHLTSKVPWYGDEDEIQGLIGVTWEITEQKRYERKLERQNERLKEFVNVVSHDLRNPLNVADGHFELAQEDCESEHLDAIGDALDRMGELIENLLALARQGKSIDETAPVALEELTKNCWQNVETAEATLVTETDHTVRADRNRLQQLLENLFRNAVEHGGQDVTITVGDFDNGRGFYVADDGPGIPEEERDEVFKSGYSTTEDGTGFGLAIVQEIVEAHGWEINATDSDDGGIRFEITGVEVDQ